MNDFVAIGRAADDAAFKAMAAHPDYHVHGRDITRSYRDHYCYCGRSFRRSQNLGLHVAAAERRVDKAWDQAYDAEVARLRAEQRNGGAA